MIHLLIATGNAHKAAEIAAVLGPSIHCRWLKEFPDAPTVVEDAPDFSGNALKKATVVATWLMDRSDPGGGELPAFVLADDSGLEVDALGGAPGVHSARFAALDEPGGPGGPNSTDAANNAKLLRLLAKVPPPERTARFRCVLALVPLCPLHPLHPASGKPHGWAHGTTRPPFFVGLCEGRIALAPSGAGGFGYDPLFVPDGHHGSFAELGEELKNTLSHRARALGQLRDWLNGAP